MSVSILFVHGGGPGSHAADSLLADGLQRQLGSEFDVQCPLMPYEDEPDYAAWKAFLLPWFAPGAERVVAVGHSIGGSVLAKLFTEERIEAHGLVLVSAPFWRREGFWRWDEVVLPDDADTRLPPGLPVLAYHGAEDSTAPVGHLTDYGLRFPRAVCHVLPGRDHQLCEDMTEVAEGIRSLPFGRL